MKKLLKMLVMTCAITAGLCILGNNVQAKDADGDVVIVIDAGHGADDPGSISASTGVYEKDCNLAIAMALKAELGKYDGVKVYLTRSDDSWMTNTGRAMEAAALNADFLISCHNNSGSESNSGALAYRSINPNYSEATNDMCTMILDNLAELGLKNGGVQTRVATDYDYEDYYTLIGEGVRAGVPSIIVEHCFLSNAEDAAYISNSDGSINEEHTTAMGVADAKAIAQYFNLSPRTAQADGTAVVTLSKSYSVKVNIPDYSGDDASWYSVDKTVATVDENGIATAVGAGTTNIVYKLSDGTTGQCQVEVKETVPVAVVGGIDPTFYKSAEEFAAIDIGSVFGFELFSDGFAQKIKPTVNGTVDTTAVGIQDIPITYDGLEGTLRVVHNSADYKPEVTLPEPTQEPATTLAPTESVTTAAVTKPDSDNNGKSNGIMSVLKYVIVLLIVVIVAVVLVIVERSRKHRRRRNRSRKIY